MKSTFKKMTALLSVLLAGALLTATAVAQLGPAHADNWRDDDDQLAQVAELEQLHATFHAAVSVHDPVQWRFACSDNSANPRGTFRSGLKTPSSRLSARLPRQEIISAMAIRMIPKLALYPRATRLPLVNRARCARSSSMFPAGCR